MKEKLLERKKEIIIGLLYLVLFSILSFIIGLKCKDKSIIEQDKAYAEEMYNIRMKKNLSEVDLLTQIREITKKVEVSKERLPSNLKVQNVNEMLKEIQANNNIFTLGNCSIESNKEQGDYTCIIVKVGSLQGNYSQLKSFLKYVGNYKSKISVTQMDVDKLGENITGSMRLTFYGAV